MLIETENNCSNIETVITNYINETTGKPDCILTGDNLSSQVIEQSGMKYKEDEPLFISRKNKGFLLRQQAYKIINDVAKSVGIKERIGTHTLRKTFGYHAYNNGYDITLIQKLFNHSSPAVTLRYIGITQDEMDNVYLSLDL